MKRFNLLFCLLCGCFFLLNAQYPFHKVLQEIESNNTSLKALQKNNKAEQVQNKSDIYWENPEVEFGYLWSSPASIGNRIDFSVSQTFDFPGVYSRRNKVSDMQNDNIYQSYRAARMELLLETQQTCIDLAYYNTLLLLYKNCVENVQEMAEFYRIGHENGHVGILDVNKAKLYLSTVQSTYEKTRSEKLLLEHKLQQMNGGKDIRLTDDSLGQPAFPVSFEDWISEAQTKSPALRYLCNQMEISRQQIKLSRSETLPKISIAYMSEKTSDEHFQGIVAGVSIPLWENKNQVKKAMLQAEAAASAVEDAKVHFIHHLSGLYQKASVLYQTSIRLKSDLATYNSETLLKTALEKAEISLDEYLTEVEFYNNTRIHILEIEREYLHTLAELEAVEL